MFYSTRMRRNRPAITLAELLLAMTLLSCNKPPDLSRILGHTSEEVREYLGNPQSSDPRTEDYKFTANGREVPLGVIYGEDGKATMAITLGALGLPKWTEAEMRDWLGTNCTVEVTSQGTGGIEVPPGVNVGFSAAARLPCTQRVY